MTPSAGLFIGGRWTDGSGPAFQAVDPSHANSIVWSGNAASGTDVDAAVSAAHAAFPDWADRDDAGRADIARAFAATLERRRNELAAAISREVGKPPWEAASEVQSMIGKVDLSIRAQAARCSTFSAGSVTTRFRPHGVCAVFGPFNFPGHLPNGHIVPALLAGNTIVLKPSEFTPGVAAIMTAAWEEAGLPPGVLNLLQGGRDTGAALAGQEGIDGLFFTGSAATGAALHRAFAGRPDRILALEMGGNNPLVVDDSAATLPAAALVLQSAFITAGQRCTCARRLIVPSGSRGDSLLAAVIEGARRIAVGPPSTLPQPFHGPVISAAAAGRLLAAQDHLATLGARPLLPLRLLAHGTGLLSPGIIDVSDVPAPPDDELFGPLLQVIRVRDFDHALRAAGATRFGLAAGLVSADRSHWDRFRRLIRAGILNWNQPLPGASGAAPFGGIRASGNHRPSAWLAADYCAYPVASMEAPSPTLPSSHLPGFPSWPRTPPQEPAALP